MSVIKRRSEDEPKEAPVTTRQVKRLYERPPSFTDLLPWMEYNPASRTFLLEDGLSVGALFEITPAGTEARTRRTWPRQWVPVTAVSSNKPPGRVIRARCSDSIC